MLGTFEIDYEENIVINDFDVCGKINLNSTYKDQIITIANQIVK